MTVGLLNIGHARSGFNGGKTEMNFSFLQASSDDAFINRIKGAQTWTALDNSTGPDHDLFVFDSDGYPTAFPGSGSGSTGITSLFYIPTQARKPGRYYADWVGGGSIGFVGCSVVSGSSLTNASTGTYRTLLNVNNQFAINPVISAVGTDGSHVHNLAFIHEDDIAAWDAGEKYWSTKFLSSLRYLNVGVLRFLDWEDMNHSTMTTWASRKPISWISYTANEIRPSLWAGGTSHVGNDYSTSFGSGAPTSKQQVHIKLDATASITEYIVTVSLANPAVVDFGITCPFSVGDPITLSSDGFPPPPIASFLGLFVKTVSGNTCTVSHTAGGTAISTLGSIGSSGAITATRPPRYKMNSSDTFRPMLSLSGQPLRPNNNATPLAGHIATLTYDAEFDAWLMDGGISINNWGGIHNDAPLELMFDLCAKVGAHPWFDLPMLAADPISDWPTGLATYHRDNVMPSNPWMIPRYEGPNEFWQTAGIFITTYGVQKGFFNFGLAGTSSVHEEYGKIMSTYGQAIQAVYGGALDGTKFHIVSGTQNATGTAPTQNDARMTSPLWVGQTSSAQAAHNWITHHCTGGYINSIRYVGNQTVIDGFNYLITHAGDPTGQMVVLDSYGTAFGGSAVDIVINSYAKPLFDWAKAFTNRDGFAIKNCGYEGGPADDFFGPNVSNPVTGISKAANAVVTVGTPTSVQGISAQDSLPNGHPFVAGMAAALGSVGGMTQINNAGFSNTVVVTSGNANIPFTGAATVGQVFYFVEDANHPVPPNMPSGSVDGNFYYVVSVSAGVSIQVSRTKGGSPITPNGSGTLLFAGTGWKVLSVGVGTVTLDCDSSAFSTYTSGGNLTVVNGDVYLNVMRAEVRRSNTLATSMVYYYNSWIAAGAAFPPQYAFALPAYARGSNIIGSGGHTWGFINDIYDPTTPYYEAIHTYNS